MTLNDMTCGNHECSVWHKARAQKMKFPLFYNPARTCCPTLRAPAPAGGHNVGLQGVVGMVGASWGQGFKIAEVGTAVSGFRAGGLRQHSHSRRHSTPPPNLAPLGPGRDPRHLLCLLGNASEGQAYLGQVPGTDLHPEPPALALAKHVTRGPGLGGALWSCPLL